MEEEATRRSGQVLRQDLRPCSTRPFGSSSSTGTFLPTKGWRAWRRAWQRIRVRGDREAAAGLNVRAGLQRLDLNSVSAARESLSLMAKAIELSEGTIRHVEIADNNLCDEDFQPLVQVESV